MHVSNMKAAEISEDVPQEKVYFAKTIVETEQGSVNQDKILTRNLGRFLEAPKLPKRNH